MSSLYGYILYSAWKDTLTLRSHSIMRVMMWVVRIVVLIFLYRVAYTQTQTHALPISLTSAIWSLGGYFVLSSLSLRILYRDISDDIQQGSIELHLSKPYNYLLRMMFARLGRGLPELILSFCIMILLLGALVGTPTVTVNPLWIARSLLVLFLGIPLSLLLYSIVGLTAAWLEDASPVFWIVDKSVMILGGSYVPIALFPESVRWLANHSPFGAIMFVTHIFNQDFPQQWSWLVLTQTIWISVLGALCVLMYRRVQQRLLINGG